MKTLEDGKTRIQRICDAIRKDTLEPAKQEAQRLREEGEKQKQDLINEGRKEKERLIEEGRAQIEQEHNVFESSLLQATKQAVENFKQQLETKIFNDELYQLLQGPMSDPMMIVHIIEALIKAIDKDGLAVDLRAEAAKNINPEEVNKLIASRILDRLKKHSIEVGSFAGGAKVSLKDKNMSVSLTLDDAKNILAEFLQKEFRSLIFAN